MAIKPWAVILCTFDDVAGTPHPSAFYASFFNIGTGGAIDYWRDISGGAIDLAGSKVYGWFSAGRRLTGGPTDRRSIFNLGVSVAQRQGIDLSPFSGTIVFVNAAVDSGNFGIGNPQLGIGFQRLAGGDDTWSANFVLHEMGHCFGLSHSRGPDPNVRPEYGDRWCLMGYGYFFPSANFGDNGPRICAPKAAILGGIPPARVFENAFDEVAVLQLAPLEQSAADGFLMARTPISKRAAPGTYTTVEFRIPLSWDQGLPSGAVLVHNLKPDGHSDLLVPAGSTGPTEWVAGQRFVDATNGLSMRVLSINVEGRAAVIEVGPFVAGWEALNGVVHGPCALASWAGDRLDVCARGGDNAVYHRYAVAGAWGPTRTNWESLSGTIVGNPAMVSWGDQRLDIVARAANGSVWHKYFDHGVWGPPGGNWEPLGGQIAADPVIVSWGDQRLDIFALGPEGSIWHKYFDHGFWGPSADDWESLGGFLVGSPAAVTWGKERLDIVALGPNGTVYHKYFNHGTWGPSPTDWESLGDRLSSDPAIVSWGAERLDIVARGPDGAVWHKYFDHGTWGPSPLTWDFLAGIVVDTPKLATWGDQRLDIIATGPDGSIWHKYFDHGFWGPSGNNWEGLGGKAPDGTTIDSPSIISTGPNRLDIIARDANGRPWHRGFNNGWTTSQRHPALAFGGSMNQNRCSAHIVET